MAEHRKDAGGLPTVAPVPSTASGSKTKASNSSADKEGGPAKKKKFADDQMMTMEERQTWQARSFHGKITKRHVTAAQLVRSEQAAVCSVTDSPYPRGRSVVA